MATIGGPNTEKDNLIFGYDTGYGVADNDTAIRFYPGENTANLFLSPNFTNHTDTTVGTTSIVKEDFGDGKIGIRMIQEGTSDIASFSMGSYSAPSSAGTYTWSSFIHSTSTGGKVKAQVTVYVNGTRHWLTNSNTWTTSVTECSHLFIATIANQWHRIENQFTLPTGTLTNLQLGSFYRTTSNFTIKLANAQFELKQHTTPFVDGTRSSTQSLIDLKRTRNIDVSNVSFDSTGQPSFDGTDDRLDNITGVGISNYSSPFSMECVFKVPTSGTWANNRQSNVFSIAGSYAGQYGIYKKSTDTIGFQIRDASTGGYCESTGHSKDVYHHVIVTFGGGSGMKLYINGELKSSNTTSFTGTPDSTNLYIGGQRAFGGSSGEWFDGEIPIAKYYDKELTSAEIGNKFNSIRKRFGI
tara:strand:+ start:908 stop:2143 length:1236 start_codon:yes stop_codon:yes gene_type:complete